MVRFLHNLSNSKVRIIYFTVFILAFSVTLINILNILIFNATSNDQCAWREIPGRTDIMVITDIVPGGVADVAGLKNQDILLKINNKSYDVSMPALNPMNIVNNIPGGDYATYLIERDGRQMEIKVQMLKVFNYNILVYLLLGFGFMVVGLIVVASKPDGSIQRFFAGYALFVMMYFTTITVQLKGIEYLTIPLNIIIGVSRVFGPPVFLVFFFYFPHKIVFPKLKILFWIIVLIDVAVYGYLVYARADQGIVGFIGVYFPSFMFFSGLGLFTYSYFKKTEKKRRKQLRPIFFGILIAFISYVYFIVLGRVNPFAIFINPVQTLPCLLMLVLPVTFGYSIFKYRLMDTELLLKKGIIYSIVTVLLALLYFSMVFGIGNLVGSLFQHQDNNMLMIISLVIIAFLFDPFKSKVQSWVDKVFYRDKNEYREALLEFSKIMPMQLDTKELMDSIVNTISNSMHIDKAAGVLISNDDKQFCFSKNVSDELCRFSTKPHGIINLLSELREPINTTLLKDDRHIYDISDEEFDKIERSEIQLIVPMMIKNKVIGFINTGKKLSGKPYSNEDIEVLKTVASQAAIAVENVRLLEKEKDLIKVQNELNLAYSIQSQWIPDSSPRIEGFDISGYSRPARTVGGDYFDFINIGDDKTAICIGDVSGKGLPAALMMANLQAIIRSQVLSSSEPDVCLNNTNRIIFESSRTDMFITLFISILDAKKKKLVYSNAGHNYPFLRKSDGRIIKIEESNLVLGIYEYMNYEKFSIDLEKGDTLLLYSDGITEASSCSNLYGEERLAGILKVNSHLKANELVELIIKDVISFSSGEQDDDITVVVIKCG